ncbi:hypothetical protein SAMN04487767_11638 [Bacillus wiedmannii]|uniref:Uncharacterized protein n=1 Tax=Bacillus wiedmannii TaxID=1890302 RepID=A0A1G7AWV5_9BACI|nr:hypothetical protein [Bacillus wiedmannii]SDE19057.1 hypothetical protein SAMN04487767_11638 [Bacillus wiedmannii]
MSRKEAFTKEIVDETGISQGSLYQGSTTIHQLKKFIMPQNKKCTFLPRDVNFLVLEYLLFLA